MNVLCRLGLHRWEMERVNGIPMRECRKCSRCEFQPRGYSYWWEAGEGVTIAFQKQFYLVQDKLEELRILYRNNEITFQEWQDKGDALHETLSGFTTNHKEKEEVKKNPMP